MGTALKVENLSKKYIINHNHQENYIALRDVISQKIRSIFTKNLNYKKSEFWALKDVSFEIEEGDRVGIIGRNGAGKSTLLKLISRITNPTIGTISMRGRVASLLEVGTGFHPELTGNENIYLNGAILGMQKAEIKRKFDEIVNFAEIEEFIDTPVKRYSSGMYMRLAFSVAAHLQTEILIVDEVLAVGDAQFQKKCISKMEEIGSDGRTVLFVSHNMNAIQSLCNKGIILQRGEVEYNGGISQAVEKYMNIKDKDIPKIAERTDRRGSLDVKILDVKFINTEFDCEVEVLTSGMPITIEVSYECKKPDDIKEYLISLVFCNSLGQTLIACSNEYNGQKFKKMSERGKIYCKIDKGPLNVGRYFYRFYSEANGNLSDVMENAGEIEVEFGDFYHKGVKIAPHINGVFIDYNWTDNKYE